MEQLEHASNHERTRVPESRTPDIEEWISQFSAIF